MTEFRKYIPLLFGDSGPIYNKNLYDYQDMKHGYLYNNACQYVEADFYTITPNFKCSSHDKVIFTTTWPGSSFGVAAFDKEQHDIRTDLPFDVTSYSNVNTTSNIYIPKGSEYFAVSGADGSQWTRLGGISLKKMVVGDNLVDNDNVSHGYYNSSGIYTESSSYDITDYIDVTNGDYSIFWEKSTSNRLSINLVLLDSAKSYIGQFDLEPLYGTDIHEYSLSNSNVKYFRIYWINNRCSDVELYKIS